MHGLYQFQKLDQVDKSDYRWSITPMNSLKDFPSPFVDKSRTIVVDVVTPLLFRISSVEQQRFSPDLQLWVLLSLISPVEPSLLNGQ